MNSRISVRKIVFTAALTALEIVLSRFCSINTAGWKIGFGFVPVAAAAVLFGPWYAAVVGGLSDLVGALLFPIGAYFPGFTVTAAIIGIVYGLFLYKKDVKFFPGIVIPTLINSLVIGLCINTLWVSILYGSKTYWGWFVYRLPEYAVLIPLNLIFLPFLCRLAPKLAKYTEDRR